MLYWVWELWVLHSACNSSDEVSNSIRNPPMSLIGGMWGLFNCRVYVISVTSPSVTILRIIQFMLTFTKKCLCVRACAYAFVYACVCVRVCVCHRRSRSRRSPESCLLPSAVVQCQIQGFHFFEFAGSVMQPSVILSGTVPDSWVQCSKNNNL